MEGQRKAIGFLTKIGWLLINWGWSDSAIGWDGKSGDLAANKKQMGSSKKKVEEL